MARLLMLDGSKRNVSYNTAAEILQVLNGLKQPKNDIQAKFVALVQDVDFGDGTAVTHAGVDFKAPKPKELDPKMKEIMNDPKLKGIAKARAVAQYIKQRQLTRGENVEAKSETSKS